MSENVDVVLKSTKHKFPYRRSTIDIGSIKIVARKQGLNFLEKILGKHTVVDYFPIGNLREYIQFDFKGSFADFLRKTISRVK